MKYILVGVGGAPKGRPIYSATIAFRARERSLCADVPSAAGGVIAESGLRDQPNRPQYRFSFKVGSELGPPVTVRYLHLGASGIMTFVSYKINDNQYPDQLSPWDHHAVFQFPVQQAAR
jgi:hypothetical protein